MNKNVSNSHIDYAPPPIAILMIIVGIIMVGVSLSPIFIPGEDKPRPIITKVHPDCIEVLYDGRRDCIPRPTGTAIMTEIELEAFELGRDIDRTLKEIVEQTGRELDEIERLLIEIDRELKNIRSKLYK